MVGRSVVWPFQEEVGGGDVFLTRVLGGGDVFLTRVVGGGDVVCANDGGSCVARFAFFSETWLRGGVLLSRTGEWSCDKSRQVVVRFSQLVGWWKVGKYVVTFYFHGSAWW